MVRGMAAAFRAACAVLSALSLAGLSLLTLHGCDGKDRGSTVASGGYRIAVIPKGTTHTFWKSIHAGALKGARGVKKEEGIDVEIIWQGPIAEDAREEQRQYIESFIGQDIDGIVLAPLDEHALVTPVNQARAAGKPVVIIDSGLNTDNYVSFVATDNYKGGVLAGKRVGELLGRKGKALLLRYLVGSASTTKREQGFIDTIKKEFPDIELLPPGLEQYAGATSGKAQNVSETLLNTYQDIGAIFCPNESSAVGMLEALKKSGRAGKIKFVGFDSNDKLVQAMKDGHIHGLILQDPVRMGDLGVRTMVAHLQKKQTEKRIDTGVHLVTLDNMETPENRRLLVPDISILEE